MPNAHRCFLFLALFSASIILASAADPKISDFTLRDQQEITIDKGVTVYYKFQVPEINEKFDLSVIADPIGDSDPEIFLSTKEHYPNSKETSEYYSTSYGYSSIYVKSSAVKVNTDYFLGVMCPSEQCHLRLSINYAQEYYMRPEIGKAIIDYQHEGTIVARIYIPRSEKIEHIVIAAEVKNLIELDEGIHMYANLGNTIPTSQNHDLVAETGWGDGIAAFIYRGDKNFRTDCNYTVVIQAPKKSKVILTRTAYGEVIPTNLNSERNDAVEANHTVVYSVDVKRVNPNTSMILIEVKPYYGHYKVYANYDSQPNSVEKYEYSMEGHTQEIFFVPVDPKTPRQTLYIAIRGDPHATYTLKVSEAGRHNLLLNVGEPEVSYVPSNEVQNFITVIDGDKDLRATFSLHPERGHADLFVKSCADKNKCSFTRSEVDDILSGKIATSKRTPIIQFSNVTDGDEVINIQMDGSVCSSTGGSLTPQCYFAVGVLGTSKNASMFTITANKAGLHQALRVGLPVREHLSSDGYKFYYFTVTNDTGINSVNFQVTKISGDVGIYTSRMSRYPDINHRDKVHHYNDLYSYESTSFPILRAVYYIGVKAFSSATYSILPIVKYNTSREYVGGRHLVQIAEGIPQKIVLDNSEPVYFKFDVNFDAGDANGIEIALNEVQGNFEICVRNDDQLPSSGFCQFNTTDNILIIPADSGFYKSQARYVAAIFPKVVQGSKGKSTAQSFSITWSAFRSFRTISFGVPFSNWVTKTRSLFYKLEVHPGEDKEIVIHKSTFSNNAKVNLFLASSAQKFGHNISDYDRASQGNDSIKLVESDIDSLCQATGPSDESKCYLYLAVTTETVENVLFTLTITKDFDDLRLSESVLTYYSFPSVEHPLHLYYYPHHIEDINILAHTWGRHVALYANIINTREYSSRKEWKFPTNKTYDYTSMESTSHSGESRLQIKAGELASCDSDADNFRCGVAITLYHHPDETHAESHFHYQAYDVFSIIANQEITPITTGKPVHTSVNENAYKYFSLYVNKDEAKLLVSASVISGKHIVILATKGKDARPTMADAQFMSSWGKIETLQISGEDTLQGSAKGYWVFAIYGFSKTEFVLNVVYEKNKIIELHRGLPATIDVSNDPVFFEYYHEVGSSFQIKLTRERGAGVISMKKYTENTAVAGNLPTEKNGDYIKHFDEVQTTINVANTTTLFTQNCMYIIGVFAHKSMKVSVVAQLPDRFIYLQDNMIFTDFAAKNIRNRYEHVAWSDRDIDVNLVVYSGEPHVYISHNPTVNETNYIWKHTELPTNNFIRMKLERSKVTNQSLESVFDGFKFVPSQSYVYYIVVTAPIGTNYSIAISTSNSTRYLVDGLMDFGFLNSGEFNLYKYHVSQDAGSNSTYKLKLQFAVYEDELSIAEDTTKFVDPQITVVTVPHNVKNTQTINHDTLMPELNPLLPLRKDVLERGHGDARYLMNLQYLAPPDHDFYIIINNTKSLDHLNYSITANTHEPLYLTMNNVHASRLPVGESDVYAVHASHAGLLVIEIHECLGSVVVESSHSRHFVSKSLDGETTTLPNGRPDIDDESYEENAVTPRLETLSSSTMGSHIKLASIEIQEEQTIYIIVRAFDGKVDSDAFPDSEAVYKIKTNLHSLRNFMPFQNLAPGNDGNLEWDITSGGKLKLGFDEVSNLAYMSTRVKSTKFGDLDIDYKYDVFFTKSPQAALYLSRCDMLPSSEGYFKGMDRYNDKRYFDQSNITTDPQNSAHKYLEVSLADDITDVYATLKVTAIGRDAKGQPVWDYPLLYKTAEVKKITPGAVYSFLTFMLVLCMVMLIVALIGLYYYYHKFKRVKARLNYEMQDLRNIASTVESFDVLENIDEDRKKKGGYLGLIEEEAV